MKNPIQITLLLLAISPSNGWAQNQSTLKGDLNPSTPFQPITDAQKTQIQSEIEKIKSNISSAVPQVVGAPDYEVARARLQALIQSEVLSYINSLSLICQDLNSFFSKLEGLKTQDDGTEIMANLYNIELRRSVPMVQAAINLKYSLAIRNLYLVGSYNVAVEERKKHQVFGVDRHLVGVYASLGCITAACALKITDDLNAWYSFVGEFNQNISLTNYSTAVLPSNKSLHPFVTESLLRALDGVATGPKVNISYDLANYFLQFLKVPAGEIAKVSIVPTFIFEKLARTATQLFDIHFEKLELSLNAIETYSEAEILEAIDRQQRKYAETLPAVLYGSQIDQYLANPSNSTFGNAIPGAPLSPGYYAFSSGEIVYSNGITVCYYLTNSDYQKANSGGVPLQTLPVLPGSMITTGPCPFP